MGQWRWRPSTPTRDKNRLTLESDFVGATFFAAVRLVLEEIAMQREHLSYPRRIFMNALERMKSCGEILKRADDNTTRSNVRALPNEVTRKILSFVEDGNPFHRRHPATMDEWANLRLVNTIFYDLSNTLFPQYTTEPIQKSIIKRLLQGGVFSQREKLTVPIYCTTFLNLEIELDMPWADVRPNLKKLLENCPNAEKITIEVCDFDDEYTPFTPVNPDNTISQERETDFGDLISRRHLQKVSNLTLSNFSIGIFPCLQFLPSLTHLSLSGEFLNFGIAKDYPVELPELLSLNLRKYEDSQNRSAPRDRMQWPTMQMPKLQFLDISAPEIDLDLDIISNMPNLRILRACGVQALVMRAKQGDSTSSALPPERVSFFPSDVLARIHPELAPPNVDDLLEKYLTKLEKYYIEKCHDSWSRTEYVVQRPAESPKINHPFNL